MYVFVWVCCFCICYLVKTLRHEGWQDYSTLLRFSKSEEHCVYIVIPTVIMKCLPADVHLSNLQKSSINEPHEQYHTWVKLPQLLPAMQTFMAALHSGETIRTNCSRVQQSRPGTIIYEANHLWVPYERTKHWPLACRISQSNAQALKKWRYKNASSSVHTSRISALCSV